MERDVNEQTRERLYNLLPAIDRARDADQGESLRTLMAVIESEFDRLQQDIGGLYEDWFIETCADWVVPYLGDLLGARSLHSVESAGITSLRAYVANTLRYRRRKGTAPVLEQLAHDVTGWPARAVEFFERLVATQHLNHVRPHSLATPDLRNGSELELLGGPFENATHTAEVRRIASGRGKYNIPNIGLFLWRLHSYAVTRSTARAASEPGNGRYRFSPLGNDIPLFNRPQTQAEITHLATEVNVPGPIRRRALYEDLEDYRQALLSSSSSTPVTRYFGRQPVLEVFFDGSTEALRPEELIICDLSDWDRPGWQPPDSQVFTRPDSTSFVTKAAVDPVPGRLAILKGVTLPDSVQVSYAYGFSGDIGGGPYNRRQSLATALSLDTWTATVDQHDPGADYPALGDALAAWAAGGSQDAIVTITDNSTYAESLSIIMSGKQTLTIQAADGKCPVVRLLDGPTELADLAITGGADQGASLTLNGLWFEGGICVDAGSLGALQLAHCTLVPGRGLDSEGEPLQAGRPSIVAGLPNAALRVSISHSIVGPVRLPDEIASLTVSDSVVHSPLRGGPARHSPALVSGNLKPFPGLTSVTPSLHVKIGEEGPHTATLATRPTTLGQARQLLEAAIRTAHGSVAFTEAGVATGGNRLVVVPGTPATVSITSAEGDPSAEEFRLADGSERLVQAVISAPLSPFPVLTSPAPALSVTMADEGTHPAVLASVPGSLTQARVYLHNAIRAAHVTPAFQNVIVASGADRLVLLPGTEDTMALFGATSDDRTTFRQLGLHEDRPAIGASDIGYQPGPRTRLERTTVFGNTCVYELELGSESIFTGVVTAQRRQTGCTRFSYLPEGSQAPRRYRCQPDLALHVCALEAGKSIDKLTEAQRATVLARLTPIFTSESYGNPAYAQLGHICATEISTGTEDGSEMGVFSHLRQPQRNANLGVSLDEYIRLGLEAGVFHVT